MCITYRIYDLCYTQKPTEEQFFFLLKCYRGVYIGYFGFLSCWAVLLSTFLQQEAAAVGVMGFTFAEEFVSCSHQHVQVVEEEVHPSTHDFGTRTSSAMLTEGHVHTINSKCFANMTQIWCSDSHIQRFSWAHWVIYVYVKGKQGCHDFRNLIFDLTFNF